ncbi:MAG: ComEA family DNA-binding protein [Lawsonibacter sp.]|nr:ComEA family DNA-binding protein [Lawsonibacter sp.]
MERKSRYGQAVLALATIFAVFCGAYCLGRASGAEPFRVTARQHPSASYYEEETAAPEQEGTRPDSLLPGEVINVNTADVYDLQRLPGIGEKRARDIIAYREEHGPFQSVDELTSVTGIGPVILDNLREYVTVETPF